MQQQDSVMEGEEGKMVHQRKTKSGRMAKRASLLLLLLAIFWIAGCSTGEDKLRFNEVALVTDPASPTAGPETKLIVEVENNKYKDKEAKVQIQINSNSTLPQLLDAVREDDHYVANYKFTKAEQYTITLHMYYGGDEHYAFGKQLKVQ